MKHFLPFFFLFISIFSFAFEVKTDQATPNFSFHTFELRAQISDSLDAEIRTLDIKNNSAWTRNDSLLYGLELILLNRNQEALNYILRVDYLEVRDQEKLHLIQKCLLLNKAYEKLEKSLLEELRLYPDLSPVLSYRIKVARSLTFYKNDLWESDKSLIFPHLISKTKKNTSRKQLNTIAENIDAALRIYVEHLTSESNEIISEAYEEFGDFLYANFTESNAFISYSLSRYYYNRNKTASSKIKLVKKEMDSLNFILPSFRKIFGKIQPGRFNYEILKERKVEKDSVEIMEIKAPKKKENDLLPKYSTELIILFGIFIILLLVLLLVRVKK